MTPRLIPSEPKFHSAAESVLWQRLRSQLPTEAFLAAIVLLLCHGDLYEADLVVGYPDQGFVVIEVKGGRVMHTDDGWFQATSGGMKPMNPVMQADRAKRVLDTFARARGWSHGPIRFEHMVAFPGTDFGSEPPAPDLPRWALIAQGDLDDVAGRIWDALDKRTTDKPRPSASWVAEMADLLGGRLDPASALLGVAEARAEQVDRLTSGQYSTLRSFRDNPRVRVVGGPGTGKTWLALERARMWAAEGQLVLFVCYSRGLSRWLAQAVAAMTPEVARRITVTTFHSLGAQLGVEVPEGADQHWWDVVQPGLVAARATARYDALVVDEAQDFADSWWPPLLAMLRHEQLFVAGDEQQTVYAGRAGRPALELAQITLDENMRNTTQVAQVFGPLSKHAMRYLGGEGPPVRFVQCASEKACDTADSEVERLLAAGHAPGSIAVLTTAHRHDSHRLVELALGKDGYWDGYWMEDEVFYGTVMGFKGLERATVVLAVDGFHDGVARDVMYAGLSRARDRLIVCGDLAEIRPAVGDEVCKRLTV